MFAVKFEQSTKERKSSLIGGMDPTNKSSLIDGMDPIARSSPGPKYETFPEGMVWLLLFASPISSLLIHSKPAKTKVAPCETFSQGYSIALLFALTISSVPSKANQQEQSTIEQELELELEQESYPNLSGFLIANEQAETEKRNDE